MIVMKLPPQVAVDELRTFKGTLGTLLNPILDADGDLIVSMEEWNSAEFAYLKEQYPDLAALFTEKEYNPIIYDFIP